MTTTLKVAGFLVVLGVVFIAAYFVGVLVR